MIWRNGWPWDDSRETTVRVSSARAPLIMQARIRELDVRLRGFVEWASRYEFEAKVCGDRRVLKLTAADLREWLDA